MRKQKLVIANIIAFLTILILLICFQKCNRDITPKYGEFNRKTKKSKNEMLEELFLHFNPKAVTFETGSAELSRQGQDELCVLAERLSDKNYHSFGVLIEGHTDNVGDAKSNKKLSQKRARSIRSYLINQASIAPSRTQYIGYGMNKPKASNKTKEGREMNRRVEFSLFDVQKKSKAPKRFITPSQTSITR